MATKVSLYDENWLNQIAYKKALEEDSETNTKFVGKLQKLLLHAIDEELTERQKEMLKLYYFENCNMPQIAKKYSLNKSTVCRHIKNAKNKIKYVMKYVMLLHSY